MIIQDQDRMDLLGSPLTFSMLDKRGVEPVSRNLLKFLEKIRALIIFLKVFVPRIRR